MRNSFQIFLCLIGIITFAKSDCLPGQIFGLDVSYCVYECSDIKAFNVEGKCHCLEIYNKISSDGKQCVKDCLAGEYMKSKNFSNEMQCFSTCPSTQLVSSSGDSCLSSCPPSEFVSSDQKFCTTSCKAGEAKNSSTKQCTPCASSEFVSSDQRSCITSCAAVAERISSDRKSCTKYCQSGEHLDVDLIDNKCYPCPYPKLSLGTDDMYTCVDICPSRKFISTDGKSCNYTCQDEEAAIVSTGKCTFCALNQLVSADKHSCVTSCNSNQFISSNGKTCNYHCLSGEAEVASTGRCTKCASYELLSSDLSSCVQSCKTFEFIDPDAKTCIKICSKFISVDQKYCLKSCNKDEGVEIVNTLSQLVQQCRICPRYFDIEHTTCNNICYPYQVISSNGKYCVSLCEIGESIDLSIRKCTPCANSQEKCDNFCPSNYYLSKYGQICDLKCIYGEVVNSDTHVCTRCTLTELDQGLCVAICPPSQFVSSDARFCVSSCSQNEYIKSDGKSCTDYCKANEFINKTTRQCTSCGKSEFINSSQTGCVSSCPQNQFISSNGKYCVTLCNTNEQEMMIIKRCIPFCEQYQYISSDGLSCVLACSASEFVSSNRRYCTPSCSASEAKFETTHKCLYCQISDSVSSNRQYCSTPCKFEGMQIIESQKCINCALHSYSYENYRQCIACSDNTPYLSADGTTCQSSCTIQQSLSSKQCLKHFSDCKGVVTTENHIKICNTYCSYGYAKKQKEGYYECIYCSGTTYLVSSAGDDCLSACPENEEIQNQKKCVPKSAAQLACPKYKLYSDFITCSDTCVYPYFLDTDNKCKSFNACNSVTYQCCTNYNESTVIDLISSENKCITIADCKAKNGYVSSSKTCVSSCEQISEINGTESNTCKSCGKNNFIKEDGVGKCIPSPSLKQKTQSLDAILSKALIQSELIVNSIITSLSSVSYQTRSLLGSNFLNNQEMLRNLLSLSLKFVNSISNIASSQRSNYFSDQDNAIKTIGQKVPKGYRVKKVNIDSLLRNDYYSLIEEDVSYQVAHAISFQALRYNPYCAKSGYQRYPIIYAQNNLFHRQLQDAQTYNAIFTAESSSSYYVCLNYDNPSSPIASKPISSSGLTYTCSLSTNVQLYLDSECEYKLCDKDQGEEGGGLSAGAIIGIISGVIILVIGLFLFGTCFYQIIRERQKTFQTVEQKEEDIEVKDISKIEIQ